MEFTWHRPCGSQASRLDMFWVSSNLTSSVLEVSIYPFFRSDHSYVYLRISFPSMPDRGPGVWKFNTSHLQDEGFTTKVRDFWRDWQEAKESFPSLSQWLDTGKTRLKRLMKRYSREQAISRRARISSLENTLYHLTRHENNGDDVATFIKETKDLLDLELLHRAQGAKVRAKERWAEEGETSRYFFRPEKTCAVRKLFTGIRNAQGVIVRSVSTILRVWCIFYTQLFTASILSLPDQDFFLNCLDLSLTDREAALCEGEVSNVECLAALNSFLSSISVEYARSFYFLVSSHYF